MHRLLALILALSVPGLAQAGIVFTPHLSEYARLAPGQYTEFTLITTEIEEIYDRNGRKVHTGAPFIPPGDSVDATLLLLKYLWIGNLFRDSEIGFLRDRPQFCRIIGTLGHQQATGNAVRRGLTAGQHSGASGLGDLFGLCGIYGLEHRYGPLKFNGLFGTTVKFPIGRYDTDSLLNTGTNYWSVIPQLAVHAELFGRIYLDGTVAWQFNGDNDEPAFGGLTPTDPADVRNLEVNLAWKFSEHWFADIGWSYRETIGPNRYDKFTLNLRDQPLPPTTACNSTQALLGFSIPDALCNSLEFFYLEPRPGPYRDRGIKGTLLTAGLYYIYRTSTVLNLRVAQPISGRGGQIDAVYDVYAMPPDSPGAAPISQLVSTQNAVQEAASVSASPYLELRLVYLFWAP
ncbi:Putative MetA-pathway of phenol degradation [Fontimonas thermophila]|uniref:Putative MetA-pathway of phenol degradation n=1 Tax=Fontimonas thermophila TaxID=1076937 RepID=A0A1I2K4R6_9GAMM|nr:transporter [Fontimonas thermophila]SFF62072.1 Putative MetA-pathway of phenol degradation [Fontimonas thermophila]